MFDRRTAFLRALPDPGFDAQIADDARWILGPRRAARPLMVLCRCFETTCQELRFPSFGRLPIASTSRPIQDHVIGLTIFGSGSYTPLAALSQMQGPCVSEAQPCRELDRLRRQDLLDLLFRNEVERRLSRREAPLLSPQPDLPLASGCRILPYEPFHESVDSRLPRPYPQFLA